MLEQAFKNIEIIPANPPFVSKECEGARQNFPIKAGELTAEAAMDEATA